MIPTAWSQCESSCRHNGGNNWALLAGFVGNTDALTPSMRKTIRLTLEDMDRFIETGVEEAIRQAELSPDTPRYALVLQISSLLHTSRQIIRFEGSFQRLDDLLRWTFEVIVKAYGSRSAGAVWPRVVYETARDPS